MFVAGAEHQRQDVAAGCGCAGDDRVVQCGQAAPAVRRSSRAIHENTVMIQCTLNLNVMRNVVLEGLGVIIGKTAFGF